MQADNTNSCPDDQTLSQVCLGDAPLSQVDAILAHVDRCPTCPARIDVLWQKAYQHGSTAENSALPGGHQPVLPRKANPLASLLARTAANLDLGFLKPSPHTDMLGRLGPYDLVRVIGSGGYGIVFEAIDPRNQQPVAIKCLRPDKLASPALRDRFLREAATPSSIGHPDVPPILDQGVDGDLPYLVMPLLQGTDFQTLIRQQAPLPIQDSVRYLKQICGILQAAHTRGIIHRDIKPSNLWLEKSASGEDRVLLLDFGLATLEQDTNQITLTGDQIGTPAYFSPEQAEGFAKGISPATDLFSLGTVAYEMLTGKRVFPGNTPLEILRNMAHFKFAQPKELRPEIPQRLNDLVMELLAWYPRQRPASADAVLEKLRHPGLLVEPWLHRRKWLEWTAGGLAALGTSALAYRWYSLRNQSPPLSAAPLLKPDNTFPLPGAITFDFNKLADFYTEPNEVYWADADGGFGTLSLIDRRATQVGRFDIRPVDLRAGVRNLLVADAEGRLQLHEMKSSKTGSVIPSPFVASPPPKSPVHMLWSGNASSFLVARGNLVFLLQLNAAS